jgi:hypothetical protein
MFIHSLCCAAGVLLLCNHHVHDCGIWLVILFIIDIHSNASMEMITFCTAGDIFATTDAERVGSPLCPCSPKAHD